MVKKYFPQLLFLFLTSLTAHSQTIYQKGDSIVMSRFGKSFFKKYITPECLYCQCKWAGKNMRIENCNDSDTSCSYYQFLYWVTIPEKEIIFDFEFSLNKNCDSLYNPRGFPPEKLSRKQLKFLSKKQIHFIAYNRRFQEGISPWRYNLFWRSNPYEE